MSEINNKWSLFCQRSENYSKILNKLFSGDIRLKEKELDEFLVETLTAQEVFIKDCLSLELKENNEFVEYLHIIERENKIIIEHIHSSGYKKISIESPLLQCIKVLKETIICLDKKQNSRIIDTIDDSKQKKKANVSFGSMTDAMYENIVNDLNGVFKTPKQKAIIG